MIKSIHHVTVTLIQTRGLHLEWLTSIRLLYEVDPKFLKPFTCLVDIRHCYTNVAFKVEK